MIAGGKIAASDCGLTGLPSPPSSGAGGFGISATTLYQCAGISDSSRRIFTCGMQADYQDCVTDQVPPFAHRLWSTVEGLALEDGNFRALSDRIRERICTHRAGQFECATASAEVFARSASDGARDSRFG